MTMQRAFWVQCDVPDCPNQAPYDARTAWEAEMIAKSNGFHVTKGVKYHTCAECWAAGLRGKP